MSSPASTIAVARRHRRARARAPTASASPAPSATSSSPRVRIGRWPVVNAALARFVRGHRPRRGAGARAQARRSAARRPPGHRRDLRRRGGVLRVGRAARLPDRRRVGGRRARRRRARVAVGRRLRPRALRCAESGWGWTVPVDRAPGGREPVRRRAARRQRLGVGRPTAREDGWRVGARRLLPRPRRGACAPRARCPPTRRAPRPPPAFASSSTQGGARDRRTAATIIDALREVYDPCCADRGISIVDMGVVEDVRVDGAHVDVDLVLTTGLVPVRGHDVDRHPRSPARRSTGVETVDVQVVWDPVWTPDRLSPSARDEARACRSRSSSPTASAGSPSDGA